MEWKPAMKRCVIFCAGGCEGAELLPGDFVIAADGGLHHCRRLGIQPDEILGDFDSLGSIPEGASVFPVEKDDTDAMLAVKRGLSLGFREFLFYGSLDGPRLDHTVANFQMLMYLADHDAHGTLAGIGQKVTLLRNGSLRFPTGMRGSISVFAMGGGESPDIDIRSDLNSWSGDEIPTEADLTEGAQNLKRLGNKVDIIITHEPPMKIKGFLRLKDKEPVRVTGLNTYFEELGAACEYKHWFFGSMHIDKFISSSHIAVFQHIINAETCEIAK